MSRGRLTTAQRKRNREAADWLLRNREAGQSEAEEAAFRQWMDADPDNCRTYKAVERLLGDASTAIGSDPALRDLKIEPRNAQPVVLSSVATLALVGSLFFLFDGPMRLKADLMSGTGEMPLVKLEDGSTMQLNASSAVAFDFTKDSRNVRLLRGQAFFQVAPDASRPFSVEANDTRVTALGTAFDVRAGETGTDVTVTEHAVLVEFGDTGEESVRLEEGQQVSYNAAQGAGDVKVSDGAVALAWRRGQLSVDNAPLSYVVEELGRHFSGRIVLANTALANRKVSGTLSVTDTEDALNFLRVALNIRTYKVGPLVVIRE